MPLNSRQKKYVKKNINNSSPQDLATTLKLPKEEVENYIKKRWGEEKLEKPLTKKSTLSLKTFLKNNWLNLLSLMGLAFIVYFNSLGNVFLSDDLPEIANNPNIGNLGYAISTHPVGFIRPLLYWAAFHINGLNPVFFRLINILLHLGNVALIYVLLMSLLSNKRLVFFATALFAIHPLLAEPVIWISGGGYPQYTFFFLLSLLFYIFSAKMKLLYLLSCIFYLLSFMSHPVMPASLILIYLTYELVFGNLRKNWIKVIPFCLILITFVFVNFAGLPEREQTLQSVHYQERGVDNIFILIPVAISSYLNLIFLPKDLTLYHSELALDVVRFTLGALECILFFGAIIFFLKKDRKIFFFLSFFFISLLPTLTPFRFNWVVAERYAYLGSIGIFVTFVYLLDNLLIKRNLKYIFFAVLILILSLLSIRTFLRNIDWKNEDNLWIATGKTSPSSPNTHNNLGDVYGRQGNKQKALQEFQKAIEIKPNYADAYHNLANTYHELKQDDKALENYQKAAQINPNLWQSYQNIASIYFGEKKYDKALENMQKAVIANPKSIQLRYNLGLVYLASGQKDKAKEVFQLILSADPKNQYALAGMTEAEKK